jgi:hypothetical protein
VLLFTEKFRMTMISRSAKDKRRGNSIFRITQLSAASLAIFLLLGGAGCASHRESSQQQFAKAIMEGNAPEASYIWHNMSARDRYAFTHGEGIKPRADQNAINARIEQGQARESIGDSDSDEFPIAADLPAEDPTNSE